MTVVMRRSGGSGEPQRHFTEKGGEEGVGALAQRSVCQRNGQAALAAERCGRLSRAQLVPAVSQGRG